MYFQYLFRLNAMNDGMFPLENLRLWDCITYLFSNSQKSNCMKNMFHTCTVSPTIKIKCHSSAAAAVVSKPSNQSTYMSIELYKLLFVNIKFS